MTSSDIVLYIAGLVACFFAGYQAGVVVKLIQDLGRGA